MTIAEQISYDTAERIIIEHVRGSFEAGIQPDIIAQAFKLPRKRVEEIIQKIRESNQ